MTEYTYDLLLLGLSPDWPAEEDEAEYEGCESGEAEEATGGAPS